jgi:hypothetical protein
MALDLEQTFRVLLDVLIPDCDEGSVPGALHAGLAKWPSRFDDDGRVREILVQLNGHAITSLGRPFGELQFDEADACVRAHRELWLACTRTIGPMVLRAYFQSPVVLAALGLPEHPPFPTGFSMDPIDYDLLEPVVERGSKYRELEDEEI